MSEEYFYVKRNDPEVVFGNSPPTATPPSILNEEEPLFVLKYVPYRRTLFYMVAFFLSGLCFLCLLYLEKSEWLLKLTGAFSILWCFNIFLDLILFKEVQLYRDRIVKIWYLLPKSVVMLRYTKLIGFKRPDGTNVKKFFYPNTNTLLIAIKGVTYGEGMADPEDAKKLNWLLARLSGRDIEEFQAAKIKIEKFFKEDEDGK